jgi:hypothetical protein
MLATGSGLSIGNNVVLTTINGSTLNAGLDATAINMGTTMTAGSIILGNNTNTGELTLRTGGILALGNVASVVNMGVSMTTGSINIGTNVITTYLNGQTVNIGTIANAGGTTVNIGNSGTSYIYANSNVYLNGKFLEVYGAGSYIYSQYYIKTPAISPPNGTTDCTVYSGLTTGKIKLGPANTTSGIVSECPHTFNKGIGFLNSNVVRDKIIRGRDTTTAAIPANSTISQTHTYTSSYIFGAIPDVVATIMGANAVIVMSITAIQPDYFITMCRNPSGVAIVANAYAVSYIAIGSI